MRLNEIVARDMAVSNQLAAWANGRFLYNIAWALARTGDSIFWLIIIGILIWQNQFLGWILLLTVALTAVLTAAIKGLVRRRRPSEKWAISTDKYSFPSGHAARAGAVAVTLSFALPSYTLLFLLWAVLVGIARVALSRHYLSDVVAGLALGIIIGIGIQLFF